MNVLEVTNLQYHVKPHFWAKTRQLLRDVSFSVGSNEIFGFLGPNGAGKTTTIKAVLGLLKPTAGAIRLFGQPPSSTASRQKLGFLPERAYFPEHLTGEEVVISHGILAGLSRADAKNRARALLERVGVANAAKQRLAGYSKGMQQRVGLAQALVSNPELVIFDEPMSGLDPIGRADVRDIMLELRKSGVTVFFSTHILADAESICDRVAIVVGGRTTRFGRLDELAPVSGQGAQIVIRSISDAARSALKEVLERIEERPEAIVLHTADLSRANAALSILRSNNIEVIEMHGRRTSLEQLFLSDARAGGHS